MTRQSLCIVLLGALAAGWAGAEEPPDVPNPPIRSGCEYDYEPFCMVRDDRQADGFSVELMRAAIAAMGRDVTFKTGPWAEIKQDLADGRLQALPMVARSPEREDAFDFTFPYYTMHGTIVVRADNGSIRGPDDLKGKRVAVLRDDIAHEFLREANLGAVIVPRSSFATAMRELSEGEHDAVVIQKLLALQIMKQFDLRNLVTVGPPLKGYSQVFCFAVREGDTELLGLLNEGLSIVMADGTYRQLHAKWFSSLEAEGRTKSRIVVGGDANYPPYEFLDANGQPAGYNVDLTKAIARQMGLSVDIRLGPWAEVRAGLDRGEIDAVHGMFYSAERDKRFDFSGPHTLIQHAIVVRDDSPPLADLQALAGKSILVMNGDIMHDLAIQHGHQRHVIPVDSEEEALRRLAAGEADCALVARLPALYWIEKHGWRNLVVSNKPLFSAEYCYAVPHGKEAILSEFTEGLAAIKHTREYREIHARWLAPYDEKSIGIGTILKYALLGAIPLFVLLAGALLWTYSLKAQVRQRTGQLQAETEAHRESEERYRQLLAVLPAAMYTCDADGRITYFNEQAVLLWSRTPCLGDTDERFCAAFRLFGPDGLPLAHADTPMAAALRDGRSFRGHETLIERPDGSRVTVSANIDPLRDDTGRICGAINVFADVTARKHAEERIRASLAEKEVLLKEIHHRVKNNMQVISSLVSLQADQLRDDSVRDAFQDVTHRVRSMALVHEKLYQSDDLARVDFAEYAESLLSYLWRAHGTAASGVRLALNLEPVSLSVNAAVPCGLILNELVSNALKHAFRGRGCGEVAVSLCAGAQGKICLRVRDNGCGLPAGFNWRQADSLGLRLVDMLSRQLGATVEFSSGEGTEFVVAFAGAQGSGC